MHKYFEHAYEGFCESMEPFANLALAMTEVAKVTLVYITLPIWVVPYAIWKGRNNT